MQLSFDPLYQNFSSNRFSLASRKGMVATSNALASSAGLCMLRNGGNAVDAAIATAACLTVVEPTANGVGGDNFAICWMKDKLYGMTSQGLSPEEISIEAVKKKHPHCKEEMPKNGWTSVTVPGVPAGWASLNKKFGNLSLLECLGPAINYARHGFPVALTVSYHWKKAKEKYARLLPLYPELKHWFSCFTKEGRTPEPFEIWTLPDLALSLEQIGQSEGRIFYQGILADKIEKQSKEEGGFLRKKDLMKHEVLYPEPISIDYRGYTVYELPPSNQGLVALMALNILKNFEFTSQNEDYYHKTFEAIKLAFADGLHYITDPKDMRIKVADLLSPSYGKKRASLIGEESQIYSPACPKGKNTVYIATGDSMGNLCSFIQSNYLEFGSGVVIDGTGISLQARGADFSLKEGAVNALAKGKKTFHTNIPGMLGKNGKACLAFGVMGAYMQPQGHVQLVSNLLDFHANPQMALDAPRFQWLKGREFAVEDEFSRVIAHALSRRGHDLKKYMDYSSFGRGQIIYRNPDGVLIGGTESRTDGNIALF